MHTWCSGEDFQRRDKPIATRIRSLSAMMWFFDDDFSSFWTTQSYLYKTFASRNKRNIVLKQASLNLLQVTDYCNPVMPIAMTLNTQGRLIKEVKVMKGF